MILSRGIVLVVLAAACHQPAMAAPVPKPIDRDTVLKKLYGCWNTVESYKGGEMRPAPREPFGTGIETDFYVTWTLGGEIIVDYHPPCRVNVTTTPWQLDIVFDNEVVRRVGRLYVIPGIFRFDGDRLIWVFGTANLVDPKAWPEKLVGRPTEFKSTKENGYGLVIKEKIECNYGKKPDIPLGAKFLPYRSERNRQPGQHD